MTLVSVARQPVSRLANYFGASGRAAVPPYRFALKWLRLLNGASGRAAMPSCRCCTVRRRELLGVKVSAGVPSGVVDGAPAILSTCFVARRKLRDI